MVERIVLDAFGAAWGKPPHPTAWFRIRHTSGWSQPSGNASAAAPGGSLRPDPLCLAPKQSPYKSGGTVARASSKVEMPSLTLSMLSWWRVFIPWAIAMRFRSDVSAFLLMPSTSSSLIPISS